MGVRHSRLESGGDGAMGAGQTIDALFESEQGLVLCDVDADDTPTVWTNQAFRKITGYSKEECLHRNCRFLQGPDTDMGTVGVIRDAIAARESAEVLLMNYRKDGSEFWSHLQLWPFCGRDGTCMYYLMVMNDVTQLYSSLTRGLTSGLMKKHAHKAAWAEGLQFDAMVEAAQVAAAIILGQEEPERAGGDVTPSLWRRLACGLGGLTPPRAAGKERERAGEEIRRQGNEARAQLDFLTGDRAVVFLDVVGAGGKGGAASPGGPGGGVMWAGPLVGEGNELPLRISYCNSAFEELSGCTKQEAMGSSLCILRDAETDPRALKAIDTAVGEGAPCAVAMRCRRPGGEGFWASIQLEPVHEGCDHVETYFGLLEEVTVPEEVGGCLEREGLFAATSAMQTAEEGVFCTPPDSVGDMSNSANGATTVFDRIHGVGAIGGSMRGIKTSRSQDSARVGAGGSMRGARAARAALLGETEGSPGATQDVRVTFGP